MASASIDGGARRDCKENRELPLGRADWPLDPVIGDRLSVVTRYSLFRDSMITWRNNSPSFHAGCPLRETAGTRPPESPRGVRMGRGATDGRHNGVIGMERKQMGLIVATTGVLTWSIALVALGEAAAIATLAPALGLTVQQIMHASRTDSASGPGHRAASLPDKEGKAP